MERVEFTKEMIKTHKILFPNMCDIHFRIIEKIFKTYGYDVELLTNTDQNVVNEGLKHIHNDMCYPALLSCGQMIDAVKSGRYDTDKVALIMTQTGGGCRASNYINLLRKGLADAGLGHVPVISISASGIEKQSGFKLSLGLIRRVIAAILYGDLLMLLNNQTKPYEKVKNQSNDLVSKWVSKVAAEFEGSKGFNKKAMKANFAQIVKEFSDIELLDIKKVKVGIVGEIYVKYSALANNNLEKFLEEQNCEVMVPGLLSFLLYCADNALIDVELYGGSKIKKFFGGTSKNFLLRFEKILVECLEGSKFVKPARYEHLKELVEPVLSTGCKMGEGWLLTAEMLELIESGYGNIICTQPFGCLPNHIAGKGMIRKIVERHPTANIVPIDYDPGATKVNQENRIKLMLSIAKENMA